MPRETFFYEVFRNGGLHLHKLGIAFLQQNLPYFLILPIFLSKIVSLGGFLDSILNDLPNQVSLLDLHLGQFERDLIDEHDPEVIPLCKEVILNLGEQLIPGTVIPIQLYPLDHILVEQGQRVILVQLVLSIDVLD